MIDWPQKVKSLKRLADEIELWAMRNGGRGRLSLGRAADELRAFAREIEVVLNSDAGIEPEVSAQLLPRWLTETGITKPLNPKYIMDAMDTDDDSPPLPSWSDEHWDGDDEGW